MFHKYILKYITTIITACAFCMGFITTGFADTATNPGSNDNSLAAEVIGIVGAAGILGVAGYLNFSKHSTHGPQPTPPIPPTANTTLAFTDNNGNALPAYGIGASSDSSSQTIRLYNTGNATALNPKVSWKNAIANVTLTNNHCSGLSTLNTNSFCAFDVVTNNQAVKGDAGSIAANADNAPEVDVGAIVVGNIALSADTATEDQHLIAKALLLTNSRTKPIIINNISFTLPNNQHDKIRLCAADSSCTFASDCEIGTGKSLAVNQSCHLWFEAKSVGDFVDNQSIPATLSFAITNTDSSAKNDLITKTVNMSYGNDLYVGGMFSSPNNDLTLMLNHIGKWNGTAWSKLDGGFANTVRAITIHKGDLFAGTEASPPDPNLGRWNGNSWSWLSDNLLGNIYTLASNGGDLLYIGGNFYKTYYSETRFNNIAAWNSNTSTWDQFIPQNSTAPGLNGPVFALAMHGNELYVGGLFNQDMSGKNLNYITKWANGTWNQLIPPTVGATPGLKYWVFALTVDGDNVYVGGNFASDNSSTIQLNYITNWANGTWNQLKPTGGTVGLNNQVLSLVKDGADLYVGGTFGATFGGGLPLEHITKWTNNTWQQFAPPASWPGLNGEVLAIALNNNDMYVGGKFATDLEPVMKPLNYITKWANGIWNGLPDSPTTGLNSFVYALRVVPSLTINAITNLN